MQTRLEELAKTVKMQQIMDRKGATASNLLSVDNVKQMAMYQDRMQTFLAPFLHSDRQGPPFRCCRALHARSIMLGRESVMYWWA